MREVKKPIDPSVESDRDLATRIAFAWRALRRGAANNAVREIIFEGDDYSIEPGQFDTLEQLVLHGSISMGNLAVRACVQEAIQRGLKMADFLPGEYRYKREWSSRVREVSDLECFHRLHPRSLLFLALRALKRRFARAEPEPAAAAATKPEENEE